MISDQQTFRRLQDSVRAYFRRVLDETGLSAANVALRAGLASTTITRFMNNRDVRHIPSTKTLNKVAAATGVPLPLELGGGAMSGHTPPAPANDAHNAINEPQSNIAIPLPGLRDLPILGYAKGGMEAMFMDNGEAQGYAERPWFLLGNPGAYAAYVHDNSMAPALENGQLLYVDPARPVTSGDDCIVELHSGEAYVKRFNRRSGTAIICDQFNPPKEISYTRDDVKSLHLIVAVLKVRV